MSALIEPWIARAVARRVAGQPSIDTDALAALERDLAAAVPYAEELVAAVSGIPAPPSGRWGVIDRASWTDANIFGMTELLAPLSEKVLRRLDSVPLPLRTAQRGLVSVEIGVLLGYLSRRVLGQYDLLFSESSRRPRALVAAGGANKSADGALYFVGVNLVATQQRFRFVPHEFALWVALHEITHRFQFAGVPWLRQRFFDLVHSYLGSMEVDAGGLAARFATAVRRLVAGDVPAEERNPAYLLATDEQREVLDEIQALMAVIEGHGNFVMDVVGAEVIPSFKTMRTVFEGRRAQQTALQRIINQAIGLEMKLRQYELGQAFCESVVAREGAAALGELWRDPSNLPTLAELREPELWLQRVA